MAKVSVILSTFNRCEHLRCALASVLNQTFQDFEVLVIGDRCTDDSEKVCQSFNDPRIQWHNLPERVSVQSGPNNEGIQRARGIYIAYLAHDDLWLPWHLETLLAEMEKREMEFVFSVSALVEPDSRVEAYASRADKRYGIAIPGTWLMKKSLAARVDPWREDKENLPTKIDREYSHRLCKAASSVQLIPKLTLVKFASTSWKTYASKELPQQLYLERILQDSKGLYVELLERIATTLGTSYDDRVSWKWNLLHAAVNHYGWDRWPISRILPAVNRWDTRRQAKIRGL